MEVDDVFIYDGAITACLVLAFDALARELFMKTKLYQFLKRVQRLFGTLELIKKVGQAKMQLLFVLFERILLCAGN